MVALATQTISPMSNTDIEIVVDDPTAPEENSPSVVSNRVVDIVVSLLMLALAVTLGWDNWRTGASWDSTGPQPGYFPFYLSVILGGASIYGLIAAFLSRKEARETFVTQAQLRRVARSAGVRRGTGGGATLEARSQQRRFWGFWGSSMGCY